MLDLIAMENASESTFDKLMVNTTLLAPNIDLRKFSQQANHVNEILDYIEALRQYIPQLTSLKDDELRRSAEPLIKVWEKLEKEGTIEAFRQAVEKANAPVR